MMILAQLLAGALLVLQLALVCGITGEWVMLPTETLIVLGVGIQVGVVALVLLALGPPESSEFSLPEMPMPRFRKRPLLIEAEQYLADEGQRSPVRGVCYCAGIRGEWRGLAHVHTSHTHQVVGLASGDWIVAEPDGEHFYPIKPDIFTATYDPE